MRHFFLIINSFIRTIVNSITSMNIIRLASFFLVIACFFTGAYFLLYRVFSYLMGIEIIGVALMDRILEMALFVFFIMLLFSNVITTFSTLYNNRELNFLFAQPIQSTSIYLAKLFENCFYASWATMVVAFPLIIAYGVVQQAPLVYYPFAFSSILIYLIMPAAIASIIIFLIIRVFPRLQSRDIILLSLFFIIGLSYLYIRISNPGILKIFETESEQELLDFATQLTTVGGRYIPSTWLGNILKAFSANSAHGFFYFGVLISTTVSTIVVAYTVARLTYARSWLITSEQGKRRVKRKSLLSTNRYGPQMTFLLKDILTFIREPTQWVQLSIFLILLAVYIFSLRRTPIYFKLPLWRTIVSFANFAYVNFVLATLGVRFIYPTISLEQNGIWFLQSSPFTLRKIIKVKYLMYLVIAIIVLEGLLLLANSFIKTDPQLSIIMPAIAIFYAASLVSINLGFACRFPQFDEDNPSKIAAGSGGIIAALASITYVALASIILATPAYYYLNSNYFDRPVNNLMILSAFIIFIILNMLTIILPLRLGVRSLGKRDF